MLRLICDKKGISLVEVMIAILLTSIGLVTLSSLQDSGWKSMAKADYVGRASGILYNTLEQYEAFLANTCNNPITLGEQNTNRGGGKFWDPVQTSGGTAILRGDITYKVRASITRINAADPQSFVVTVRVMWTGNETGISESLMVTQQKAYQSGC
jgi:Tfp pilus assembly protein PilV